MKKLLVLVLLLLVACSPPFAQIQATQNLLTNGGFEGAFIEQGAPELKVPEGWVAWWNSVDTRPEYKPALLEVDSRRVRTGTKAAQWFNNYSTHTAGLYQIVQGVAPGQTLQFSAWVQAFTSTSDDFSQSNARYRMKIGIDPYGGISPTNDDVVWSDDGHAIQPYDQYFFLSVETVAKSDRATVFIWGQPEWAVKHNNAYVDDAELVQAGTAPTPVPGGEIDYDRVEEIFRRVFREEWPTVP